MSLTLVAALSLMGAPFTSGNRTKDTILEVAGSQWQASSHAVDYALTLGVACTLAYSTRAFYRTFIDSYKGPMSVLVRGSPEVSRSSSQRLGHVLSHTTLVRLGLLAVVFFIGLQALAPKRALEATDAEHLSAMDKLVPLFVLAIGLPLAAAWASLWDGWLGRQLTASLATRLHWDAVVNGLRLVALGGIERQAKVLENGIQSVFIGLQHMFLAEPMAVRSNRIRTGHVYHSIGVVVVLIARVVFAPIAPFKCACNSHIPSSRSPYQNTKFFH
jgi:NADH:ubiquinone oxidoreductase subunit 5 (subunit L)/multisubunit Na+/H+ antiporter MnhA subunit